MTDLKIDLTDCTSLLFHSLTTLDKQAEELEQKAARLRDLNRVLVYSIQEGRITNYETVKRAMAWFDRDPVLDPSGCIKKSLEEENKNG